MKTRLLLAIALGLAGASSACRADTTAVSSAGRPKPTEEPGPSKPFELKAPDGKVVCGFVQDDADPSKCSAVVDIPEGVEVFQRTGNHFAQISKGHVVPACPTEAVVGGCYNGVALVTMYSGPKWTYSKAKRDCSKKNGRWME